jgi:hypothetical protein
MATWWQSKCTTRRDYAPQPKGHRMPISLFHRRPEPPAEAPSDVSERQELAPSTSTLSPARRALAAHLSEAGRLHARLAALAEPIRLAQQAAEREREAQQQVDAVAELEEAALRAWTATATGPIPRALDRERDECMHRLSLAHSAAALAQRQARYAEPDCRATEDQLHALNKERPALISAILREEAAALGERIIAAAREGAAASAALRALQLHCQAVDDGELRLATALALRGGGLEECRGQQTALLRIRTDAIRRWSALPAALHDDPTATVESAPAAPAQKDVAA